MHTLHNNTIDHREMFQINFKNKHDLRMKTLVVRIY